MKQKAKRSIQWINLPQHQKQAGVHLIADFWKVKKIEDSKKIEKVLVGAVNAAKATPLKVVIHKFQPQGLTGVVLLAESHLCLHSWPEIDYLAIDIFTCGNKALPQKALKYLEEKFQPGKIEVTEIRRGILE